ncbi:hypothetical protein PhCBS80983_g06177 [Powellomyces hirtus]|uniref:SRR1-like domain-containing protein n=1 Tax=Powellomyces hirtus TaxID=109895 RepID=A0A507DR99_9FUNG|nr:hypothetical protein PhCBS80983_g06177 [Powellomyces hirtus]
MEDDGFKLVSGGRRKKGPTGITKKASGSGFTYKQSAKAGMERKEPSAEDVIQKIEERKTALAKCSFYSKVIESLFKPMGTFRDRAGEKEIDVVCYGVGALTASNPQHQFALILLLRDQFKLAGELHIFDPVMAKVDRAVAEHFQCVVIEKNERGHRPVTTPTLFYMPHCGHTLYNAVLRSNWPHLPRILILGNSFATYDTLLQGTRKDHPAPYVVAAPAQEVGFPKYEVQEVFNNMSLHTFEKPGGEVEGAGGGQESDPEVV